MQKSCWLLLLLLIFSYFIYVVTLRKSMKNILGKYLQMTVLYTKYKAENNAVWTIYVKYGLKIYWDVWKFESRKV